MRQTADNDASRGHRLGMVHQGVNAGENTDWMASSIEDLESGFGWPDLVAKAHITRPRAIRDLNDGIPLKIAGDGVDQNETCKARRTINDENRNGRSHMWLLAAVYAERGPRPHLELGERRKLRPWGSLTAGKSYGDLAKRFQRMARKT